MDDAKETRVCPRCGRAADGNEYCSGCGLHLTTLAELPTREAWELSRPSPGEASSPEGAFTVGPQSSAAAGERGAVGGRFTRLSTNQRIALAGIVALIVAAAIAIPLALSGGGNGNTYPANVQTNFLNACEANAGVGICDCMLTYVERRISLSTFAAADQAIRNGDTNYPTWLLNAASACRGQ